jgi:hypothetical protein
MVGGERALNRVFAVAIATTVPLAMWGGACGRNPFVTPLTGTGGRGGAGAQSTGAAGGGSAGAAGTGAAGATGGAGGFALACPSCSALGATTCSTIEGFPALLTCSIVVPDEGCPVNTWVWRPITCANGCVASAGGAGGQGGSSAAHCVGGTGGGGEGGTAATGAGGAMAGLCCNSLGDNMCSADRRQLMACDTSLPPAYPCSNPPSRYAWVVVHCTCVDGDSTNIFAHCAGGSGGSGTGGSGAAGVSGP